MPPPDAATVAEALALVKAQAASRQQIVDITQAQVRSEVAAFTGWYDSARITAFAGLLAKLTRAGQKQTATSTDSFAVRILQLLTGKRSPAVGPVPVADLWGGVPLESVFGRLADEYRWLEATRGHSAPAEARVSQDAGKPLPQLDQGRILDRVVTRAEVQSETALTLAFREQWVSDLAKAGTVSGYRRILHPELSKGGSCGLCIVASDQIYHKKSLLPIHANCACTVMAVVGDPLGPGDPGSAINDLDLGQFYKAAGGSTQGDNLKATRFKIEQHSELGPVLVFQGQHFRTGEQAKAAERRAAARRSAARAR